MISRNHALRISLSLFILVFAAAGFWAAGRLLSQESNESQIAENSEAPMSIQPGSPLSPETDPVPACEKMIAEDAFYLDVYNILFPWITSPQTESPSLARAVELCRISLDRLGRGEEIDAFLEKTVEAHPNDWRVLAAAASQYDTLSDWGVLRGGVFIRGFGGPDSVSASARDRVTALRLFVRAMDLLEKQRAAEPVEPKLVFDFYCEFARVCGEVQPPLLQKLTDLETLPDYAEEIPGWSLRHWAPADENGNPVFYDLPESFASAKNDGQRWRFLLEKAAASGAPDAAEARLIFANFLIDQFGSQTLADFRNLVDRRDGETGEKDTSSLAAIGSLATLTDNETIARLASGIKRFPFPEGQNPLTIYRSVMEDGQASLDARTRAASDLARVYMNRRQYVKAEEVYREMARLEGENQVPEPERVARRELEMLIGNYGAFAPVPKQTAGGGASFLWLYRNGRKARFRVQEIDVRHFLKDAVAYLQEAAKNPPEDWNGDKVRLENIGWKLLNDPETARKYLSSDIADWSVDLEPASGHQDTQMRVDFPIEKPGAYLLRGKMENGNSDAIVVWLSDTAILKKQVQGKTLWYVADAKSGAPVPDAEIRFFGFTVERIAARREGTASTGSENTRWRVRTDEKTVRVNQDGWVMTDISQLNPRLHWLAEAAVPTEEGFGRFAVSGFENIWYDHFENSFFRLDRACFLSDRPIYRPNDTVHFRFQAATSRYDLPETWTWQGQPARLVIMGPGGKELVSKEVTLDETGGWEDSLETDESFNLGTYTFRLDVLNDSAKRGSARMWRSIGSGSVSLEEYRKPEFEVTVETPETPVSLGGKFTVKARAGYYFGSPVTHARARWRVIRSRAETVFYPVRRWDWLYGNGYGWLAPDAPWYPGWREWAVSCPVPFRPYRGESAEIVDSGESELGEDGTVEIPIDTSVASQLYPDTDQSYEVIVEVTDASRRLVQGSGKVLVVKKPFEVTTWAHRGFYLPQSQIDYTVSARRADGKPVSGRGRVTVSRVRLVKDPADPQKRLPQETPVLSEEISIGAEGEGTMSFTLSEPGLYRFVCAVDDGSGNRAEGGSLITVTGPGGALDEEASGSNPIDLVLEKPEYRPGEKARLRVSAPISDATVLLFVRSEDGNAGSPELLRLHGGSAFYELEITDADMPNIWVEAVTFAGGRFYSASKNIPVPPTTRVLDVAVTPDRPAYKPGEHAVMKIRVTDPDGNPVTGAVTAAVYDRSLDGLIAGGALDLKKFFWDWTRGCSARQQHTLDRLFYPIDFAQKSTMQPLGVFDDIFCEEELAAGPVMKNSFSRSVAALSGSVGFDMNSAAMPAPAAAPMLAAGVRAESAMADDAKGFGEGGGEAPIQIRSEFADTALWAGQVKTDENGEAELSFDMPENITSWKVRVWSFAPGTRVGEGESETVTRKNLILRMQRPRFLTQTDTVLLSAVVHNYTSSDQKTQVALSADSGADGAPLLKLRSGTPAVQEVLIPAGGQARVDWQVDAALAGSVPLVMTARSADDADGVRESIPIYLHGIKKQEAVSGMIPPAPEGDAGPREYLFRMTVPAERIADQTVLTVRYSPSLAGAMLDAIPYLTDYPYGCTEQTLNRFLPTVLIRKLLTDSGIDLAAIESHIANLNPQELGDAQTRRAGWQKQRLNMFGEPADGTSRRNPVFSSAEVTRRVKEGVARLEELQCGDGGWGWFGGWGEHSDPHLTALVTGGLYQALSAGVDVPEDVLSGGREWLKQYLFNEHAKLRKGKEAAQDPNRKPDPDAKTAVTPNDVLVYSTLQESATEKGSEEYEQMITEMGNFIYEDRASLPPYTLSLYGITLAIDIDVKSEKISEEKKESELARLLADSVETDRQRLDTVVRMLRQYVKTDEANQTAWLDLSGTGAYRWFWYGSGNETEAAFLRLLDRTDHNDPLLPQLIKHILNSRKNACYWDSTRDTAYCLAAFCEYLEHSQELTGGGTVEIYVDGALAKSETITPENVFEIDNTLVLAGPELSAGTHEIRIRYTGAGPLYCNGYLANFTLEPFIRKAGLETEITRTYWKLTEDGSAEETAIASNGSLAQQRVQKYRKERLEDGASVKSGDLIEVELNVLSRNSYESILIEDRKPAGFEPVDPVSGYQDGAYVEYRDARVCFFVHHLRQGTHTMRYRLRAETPGTVSALPATVEGMYAPELRGNSDEFQTTVTD